MDTIGARPASPRDRGGNDLLTLDFIKHAEDLVLYGDVGCGKTHPAIAIGRQACRSNIPVRFFTAAGLIMSLRKAKDEKRLDRELATIGRADLIIIDELGYLPVRLRRGRTPVPDHRRLLRKKEHHLHLEPRIQPVGRLVRRRRHGRRRHRPHHPPRQNHPLHRRILPQHTLTHEITKTTTHDDGHRPPNLRKSSARPAQFR